MDEPLDEYALDFLEPDARRLVKEMLGTIVGYPDIHRNRFRLQRAKNQAGFEYYLVPLVSGGPSPFRQRQLIPTNVVPQLRHIGFVERDRGTDGRAVGYRFTEAALEWHSRYGGPDPDEIRRRIGRFIQKQGGRYAHSHMYDAAEVAAAIGVSEERVREQTELLLARGLVETLQARDADFGVPGFERAGGRALGRGWVPPNPHHFDDEECSLVVGAVARPPRAPAAGRGNGRRTFDVFICHASEDKDDVVRPLAQALADRELAVWYDEFELRIGDSLRRKIDDGIANSRFGVVVLSRHFFDKDWPNHELDGLATRSVAGEQVILPIWHNISKAQVIAYSPSLADKIARKTADVTVEEIAEEIAAVIISGDR